MQESSPFLSLGFGVLFLLRRVFPEGFVQRTPCFVVAEFSLVLGVRFCMVFLILIREFFLRRFRAFGAVVSGFGSSSFLFLLLLLPFSSWGRPGSLFFSPWCLLAGPGGLPRQVRLSIALFASQIFRNPL